MYDLLLQQQFWLVSKLSVPPYPERRCINLAVDLLRIQAKLRVVEIERGYRRIVLRTVGLARSVFRENKNRKVSKDIRLDFQKIVGVYPDYGGLAMHCDAPTCLLTLVRSVFVPIVGLIAGLCDRR